MNKVILKGRLKQHPELRHSKNGNPYCSVMLSTAEKRDGKYEYQNHSLTFFNKSAEAVCQYLKEESNILIEGKLAYNKNGDKWFTNIIVLSFEFCDPHWTDGQHSANQVQEGQNQPNLPQRVGDVPF